ncbi:MAG: protein translocase subunit SecF [Chloroflexi bacterium]|nr:protein translocase subunit SecF [Chloroflexota bacterium]
MLDIVGQRFWFFFISLLIIVPGAISLAIPPALKQGIEFTSGSTLTIRFEKQASQEEVRQAFAALGHGDAIIQHSGQGDFLVRTRTLRPEEKDAQGNVTRAAERLEIEKALTERLGPLTVLAFDSVSPIVAEEIVRNAALAVAAATVGILLYITWAFRKVPNPFRFGTCAVIALVHDVLVVLGVFSIMGKVFNTEVDAMFITGLLTVIGFSVHDTIVVFDRIRENIRKNPGVDLEPVVNSSLLETLGRSLNTSLTLLFVLGALILFGGVTIRNFLLVLLIGTVSGTYSSIFNASLLLVVWEKGEMSTLHRRLPRFRALLGGRLRAR